MVPVWGMSVSGAAGMGAWRLVTVSAHARNRGAGRRRERRCGGLVTFRGWRVSRPGWQRGPG